MDTSRRRVYRCGEKIKIATLNYDLLVYFLDNPNKIISREELKENVWSGRMVSDATVYKQIKRLKQGLLDSLSNNEIIQTVHGQGVMFVSDVKTLKSNITEELKLKTVEETKKIGYLRFGYILMVSISILIFTFLIIQVQSIKQNNYQLSSEVVRLAILYHESENKEKTISTHAMAQALQSQMLMSNSLNISLEKMQGQDLKFSQFSTNLIQELGYKHVLDMQIFTHKYGVKAHILLRKGQEIYPTKEFEAISIHMLINSVSTWVMDKLRDDTSIRVMISDMTDSKSAFDDYLAALRFKFGNKPDLTIELLQQAVLKDPKFYLAWNSLAAEYRRQGKTFKALEVLDNIDLSEASDRLSVKVLNNRAGSNYRLGRTNKAFDILQEAMTYAVKVRDSDLLTTVLINQSLLYLEMKLVDKALNNLEQALTFVNESYQKTFLATIYSSMSGVYIKKHDVKKALHYIEQAHDIFIMIDEKSKVIGVSNKWANMLLNNLEFEKAYKITQNVFEYSIYNNEIVSELFALQTIIRIDLELRNFDSARVKLDTYKNKLEDIENSNIKAEYLKLEYMYHDLNGDLTSSSTVLEQLNIYADEVEDKTIKMNFAILNIDFILKTETAFISRERIHTLTDSIDIDSELWLAKANIFAHNKNTEEALVFYKKAMEKFQQQDQKLRLKKSIEAYLSFVENEKILTKGVQHWKTVNTALSVGQFSLLPQ